jgi:molybdopterin converting factor small subunit
MTVRVFLGPELRRNYRRDYNPDRGLIVQAGSGKTVTEIARELDIPLDEVSSTLVDYHVVEPNYVVKDGDSIYFLVAIGGG